MCWEICFRRYGGGRWGLNGAGLRWLDTLVELEFKIKDMMELLGGSLHDLEIVRL